MNEAVYCRNGHFIGYIPERDGRWEMSPVMHDYQERQIRDKLDRLAFCPNCGAPGVKGCLGCKRTIERDPYYSSAPPAYCSGCGRAFPWTEAALSAAKEFTDELDLSEAEKVKLKETFDDLTADTPRTEVAAHRFKKFIQKIGPAAGDVLTKIMVNIATEAAKKAMGL